MNDNCVIRIISITFGATIPLLARDAGAVRDHGFCFVERMTCTAGVSTQLSPHECRPRIGSTVVSH